MICKIGSSQIIETHILKFFGARIDSDLTFKTHLNTLCKKAAQKLNALSRLCFFAPLSQRKCLMNAFFFSQFSFSPLVWMCHSRTINRKINNLHYRALRLIYRDEKSSFEELLLKDGSVTIHHRNLQSLAIEIHKVLHNEAPPFMREIFGIHPNANSRNVSAYTRSGRCLYHQPNPKTVRYGLETISSLGPKIWNLVPNEIKTITSVALFKRKIRKWVPKNCPCRICKPFVPQLGFL